MPSAEYVGFYLVTPLRQYADSGTFGACVSIRRGVYDRIFEIYPALCQPRAGNAVRPDQRLQHGAAQPTGLID